MSVKIFRNGSWEEKGGLQELEFQNYTKNRVKEELILGLQNCEFNNGSIYVCKNIISTGFINVTPSSQLTANHTHKLIQLHSDYFKTSEKKLNGIVVNQYANSEEALCSNAGIGDYSDGYWIYINPSVPISIDKIITFKIFCLVY